MTNSLTGIFASLLALPGFEKEKIAALLSENSSKKLLSPTTLRFRPGTKALVDLISEKLGISASEVINLILESTLREIYFPFSHTAESIADRFEYLLKSHGLSPPDVAQLLSPWNLRLSILRDRERTMDYLTPPLLETLARWFYVSQDWLFGRSDCPVDTSLPIHRWPQSEEEFRKRIIPSDENNNIKIIFWTNVNSPDNEYEKRTGILIKKKETSGNVIYHPVLSITPQCLNSEQRDWVTSLKTSLKCTGRIRFITLGDRAATALEQGTMLPAFILNKSVNT